MIIDGNTPDYLKDILLNDRFSESEKNGLSLIGQNDVMIYSPGVSTGGVAEVKMALDNPNRKIIASTIDQQGIAEVEQTIALMHLSGQIEIKNEDVSKSLSYPSESFDYIYARLVLHYLPKQALDESLSELYRILKKGKKLYVVVRSTLDPDLQVEGVTYDPETGLSTYPWIDIQGNIHPEKPIQRYFHTNDSITSHIVKAGFTIENIKQHDEQLYLDFGRKELSSKMANVIELVASR